MTKADIIQILIKRDRMTYADAAELVKETQQEINEFLKSGKDPSLDQVEDVILNNLMLEPDYVLAFL